MSEENKIIGNIDTKEMHKSSCPWVKLINENNKRIFNSIESGLSNGFDGCGHCLEFFSNYESLNSKIVIETQSSTFLQGTCTCSDTKYAINFKSQIDSQSKNIFLEFSINKKIYQYKISKKSSGKRILNEIGNNNVYAETERLALRNFLINLKEDTLKNTKNKLELTYPIYLIVSNVLNSPVDHVFKNKKTVKKADKKRDRNTTWDGRKYELYKRYEVTFLDYIERLRPTHGVYRGEFVQAKFAMRGKWYFEWIIVGYSLNEEDILSEGDIGHAGDDKTIPYRGWSLGAVNHDVCQGEYKKLYKEGDTFFSIVEEINEEFNIEEFIENLFSIEESNAELPDILSILESFDDLLLASPDYAVGLLNEWDGTLICESNTTTKALKKIITIIKFRLLEEATVQINIYSRDSNEIIKSLFNGCLTKGKHEKEWNGKTDNNEIAPAGSYCCIYTCTNIKGSGEVPEFIDATTVQLTTISTFLTENNKSVEKNNFTRKVCPVCDGKKEFTCVRCLGDGVINNLGEKKCPICNGKGKNEVPDNYWTGKIGYFEWHEGTKKLVKGTKWKKCLRCGGDGKIWRGKTCPGCKGKGEKEVTYYYWTGKIGYFEWHESTLKLVKRKKWKKCWRCKGDGIINNTWAKTCPVCNGEKTTPCLECGGHGVYTNFSNKDMSIL